MFVTLTCPGYGRVGSDGTPADPARYDYGRAARDALHFAALFDRFIQNLRRFLGYDVQYFAAVEPQRRLAPHIHIAMRGTLSRTELRQVLAATYHQVWWPDPSTVTLRRRPAAGVARGQRQLPRPRDRGSPADLGRGPRRHRRPDDEPQHVARFGDRFDAQGVHRRIHETPTGCIGYLTKYLTKHVADCHQAPTPSPARARGTAGRRAPVRAVLADVRELAALRRPAARTRGRACGPGTARARRTAASTSATPGRRVLVSRKWSGKTLADHRADRRAWLMRHARTPGQPTRPAYTWEPVTPGDPDHMPHCAAAAARRRRPPAMASRARRGQTPRPAARPTPIFRQPGGRHDQTEATDIGDRLLTVEAAAERLSTSVRFIRRLIAERRIEFVRVGRHVRISEAALAEFIDAGRIEPLTAHPGTGRKGVA